MREAKALGSRSNENESSRLQANPTRLTLTSILQNSFYLALLLLRSFFPRLPTL